ncbi:MAG: hypothetical protein ACYDD4_03280 [Acidimicrobiales bacterium]
MLTGRFRTLWRLPVAGLVLAGAATTGMLATGAAATMAPVATSVPCVSGPAHFDVGYAQQDITPAVPFDFLGGTGYLRQGTTVENDLFERAVAIAPLGPSGTRSGPPVVLVSIDSQGYFDAYQAAPASLGVADYGFAQIGAAAASAAGVPSANIVFSTTHSHTAPDTLGIWGGSPKSYYELVRSAAIAAVGSAVADMQPSEFFRGTAEGSQYVYDPIPTDLDNTAAANHTVWPVDGTMTVLQARALGTGRPLLTLVNFGVHPDILEDTPLISPDWPAWMMATVQAAQGGNVMYLQGTLGSEPVLPATSSHPVEYSGTGTTAGDIAEATEYGDDLGDLALSAVEGASPLCDGTVRVARVPIVTPGTNPLLLALLAVTPPSAAEGQLQTGHIDRALVPPYLTGNMVGSVVSVIDLGGGALLDMPGEIYDDVYAAAQSEIRASWFMPVGMADDQLGYVVMPSEVPMAEVGGGAMAPAAEFSVGPEIGTAVVGGLTIAAHEAGFGVTPHGGELVTSNDLLAAQFVQCVEQGFCQAANKP